MITYKKLHKLSAIKTSPIWLLFFSLSSSVFALPVNTVYTDQNYYTGFSGDVLQTNMNKTLTSNTSPVTYANSLGGTRPDDSSHVQSTADFGVLKVSADTQAISNINGDILESSSRHVATSDASTSFQLTVHGGPGLVLGSSVSIKLQFRLDGYLNSSLGPDDFGYASEDLFAQLRVIDQNIQLGCDSIDGCSTPQLVDFSANASSISSLSYGLPTHDNDWSFSYVTTDATGVETNNQYIGNSWSGCCGGVNFNTGILSTTIDTTVGAVLDIDQSLSLLSQSFADVRSQTLYDVTGLPYTLLNNASATGDFLNTFGLVFTPVTDGVVLDYGQITPAKYNLGNTASVPEPATVWLIAIGLLGFAGVELADSIYG